MLRILRRWMAVCVYNLSLQEAELMLRRVVVKVRQAAGVRGLRLYLHPRQQRRRVGMLILEKRAARATLRALCCWCEGAATSKAHLQRAADLTTHRVSIRRFRRELGRWRAHASSSAATRRNALVRLAALGQRVRAKMGRVVLGGLRQLLAGLRLFLKGVARRRCKVLFSLVCLV